MQAETIYDVVFIGNYTKDTIISAAGVRQVDGGGFNYGAHVAAMMGLKAAAVTRLAREDVRVVENLERLGVAVFPTYTPQSTCLTLDYPTADPDHRIITVAASAGAFTPEQVRPLQARAFLVNASFRGEVGPEVMAELRAKSSLLAADAQGFLRVVSPEGTLAPAEWPERDRLLGALDIVKADAVEARLLTGEEDPEQAARRIARWGPREIVLTHREGVLVLAEGRLHRFPFRPRRLGGRSGRGDTCIAAYLCRRLSAPPAEAARWAAAVTSLKLEAEGPLRRSLGEAEEFLARIYPA
jgi:sugar/nucleoside kinase (ribokinase family)